MWPSAGRHRRSLRRIIACRCDRWLASSFPAPRACIERRTDGCCVLTAALWRNSSACRPGASGPWYVSAFRPSCRTGSSGCDGASVFACHTRLRADGTGPAKRPRSSGSLRRLCCDGRREAACPVSTRPGGTANAAIAIAISCASFGSCAFEGRLVSRGIAALSFTVIIGGISIEEDSSGRGGPDCRGHRRAAGT